MGKGTPNHQKAMLRIRRKKRVKIVKLRERFEESRSKEERDRLYKKLEKIAVVPAK